MFPINFNFPYRKKDGSLITMEKALDGAGADLDLIDLDDVAITSPAEGDGLIYDNTARKWKNIPIISRIVALFNAWKETGSYNLLRPGHASISDYGASFTENANGTVTKSGTVSGGNAQYVYVIPTNDPYTPVADLIPGKKYKLVGCPSGGGDNVYEIYIQYRNADNTGWAEAYHDYGSGVEFTAKNARFGVYIRVFDGNTDTLEFKPMITTDLNATYDDYVSFAMTNRELTVHTVKDNLCQFAYNNNICIGTLFVTNLNISTVGDWAEFYTLPSNVPKPKYGVTCPAVTYPYAADATNSAVCEISNTGSCKIYLETSSKTPVSQVTVSFMYLI